MDCPNCKDKEVSTLHQDIAVKNKEISQFHVHCGWCDDVYVIYINGAKNLDIRKRDT